MKGAEPMTRTAVAVIDVGKTHAKVLAIGRGGVVLAALATRSRRRAGFLDAEATERFVSRGLRTLAASFRVSAIVPATHGAAAALVDDAGLVHPVVDYEAQPAPKVDAAYDARRPPFAETFSPRLPAGLNLGRQLYALRASAPAAWRRAQAILTYPQYWSWRLCSVRAAEVTSLGCHTDLWQPRDARPSSLVAGERWSPLLPPLRPAWERLGTAHSGLGLPAGIAVCNGIHDSNAAYLRYLAGVRVPFALLSTGTWMIAFNAGGDLAGLDPRRDTLANVDVFGRPIACSRFMGGREYARIAGRAGLAHAPTLAQVRHAMARGLFALPSFSASGGPWPGLPGERSARPETPAQAAALATLYIALMSREVLRLTGPLPRLYVDGAFATHEAFVQVLAALLPGTQVFAAEGTDGTAIGASLLAAMAERDGDLPPVRIAARRVHPPAFDLAGYAGEWSARVAARAADRSPTKELA